MIELFFDLETIPDQTPGAIDAYIKNVKPPGQYKKPESIQAWLDENAEAVAVENWKKSALDGTHGQIVSVSWAFNDEDIDGRVTNEGYSESGVINAFYNAVKSRVRAGEGIYPAIKWIGHNILGFDLPFLWKRSVILELKPPIVLPKDARHDSRSVYDTMLGWAGAYPRGYIKQDELIAVMGIQTAESAIDGSMVWDMVQAGLYKEVLEYNKLDVEKVRAIYRRMIWKS